MRALRIVLVILLVLAGLFVAADRIAVNLAEDEVAKRLKSELDVPASGSASVSIKGFPFLTQVLSKELNTVHAEVSGVTADTGDRQVTLTKVKLDAKDVRTNSSFSSAVARSASGTVHISYADLTRAADDGVEVGYGGKDKSGQGQVKVSAAVHVPVLGRTLERSVYSTVTVENGDTVRLRAESVPDAGVPAAERVIRSKIDFARTVTQLPDGLKLRDVTTTREGIDLAIEGTDIDLAD
ncbi:DUF2993 domain-containing protein [Streptomyces boncukensis]|uniref:DUF2993 domain-containing protein n=1 Tax=Streptomyces boncukensis TaxID=2711219 RepID=A0A6G4WTN9_9ACTN|nr:DUF2993 domain-containing protein [Streptomyces boncukensis]NGO68649.1 DUF2993 domain-containing protein [Streptomyces boncukensis]